MIVTHPLKALFDHALPLTAVALLALSSATSAPAAQAAEAFTVAEAHGAAVGAILESAPAERDRTESYTVSSGGIDVIFEITRDADGAIVGEARTWMLLPDEDGYRAYVTERKDATGEFVETARGDLYDPDADGIANDNDTSPDKQRQAAALDQRQSN